VEGPSKKNRAVSSGRTEQNKLVHFAAPGVRAGAYVTVKVTDAASHWLRGQYVETLVDAPTRRVHIPVRPAP
jgi:tRNA-2-methylthio-N6-dimethylallyladenosine synthase